MKRGLAMTVWNDLRYGFRQLCKSPGFSLGTLLTLGLCIGANTAIYSVVDAVLLRPVPYPESNRLAVVMTAYGQKGESGLFTGQSGAMFEGVRDGITSLDVAARSGTNGVNFAAAGQAEYIQQQRVSTRYFRVLGVQPHIGRGFTPGEDRAGGPAVAVLSYHFWQTALRGDAGVLGRAIQLRGEPYTVVGVMPRDFRVETPVDVWTPLRPARNGEGGGINYHVIARLRPGASWAAVSDQLKSLQLRYDALPRNLHLEQRILPFHTGATEETRSELLLTWAAVIAVLLIGCVNIAGLLLARSARRRREVATRLALGGSRASIVRQLLLENLLLSAGGGILGVLLGQAGIEQLKQLGAQSLELWHPIQLDVRVLLAMFGVALFTTLLFGLVPAIESTRVDIRSALIDGGRSVAGGGRRWLRSTMIIAEVALSLVLLVSAGLLVRSLEYLNGLNPGFDTQHVRTAQTSLQDARYGSSAAVNRLYSRGLEQIRRIPGVESAAVALSLPFERPLNSGIRLVVQGNILTPVVEEVYATPGYFETVRIPILEGRTFRESDKADSARVAMVSQSFARKFYPDGSAMGRQIGRPGMEIVGIIGDVQQHSGIDDLGPLAIEPTVYLPVSQLGDEDLQLLHTWFAPKWVVRAQGSPGALAAAMQRAIASVDPQLPMASFHSIKELRSEVTEGQRYDAALFSILAGLALLLSAVGLYGLISESVAQRTREIGIRMALGASIGDAITTTMKPGIMFAVAGVGLGLVLAVAAVRLLQHMLWGVRPLDAATFAGTAALLLLVAILATLLPALRLLRLDPALTLRHE